ncbi:hypothetical protein J2X69_003283 [Algoriphagus sp. 4150]|uniref:DUF4374 domain-containing protein n=1 Tax=Algoriphagus sp. 4150 TaxID=2817756 RepID=UPI002866B8AD|nr:DUF4374 domain-containing protein [Algoriphagus sp. 4150]MDR7130924.1 hypothetical protein [Algoriphagus sp. 4150]
MKKHSFLFLTFAFISLLTFTACDDNEDSNPIPSDDEYNFFVALSLPGIDSYPFHLLKGVETGSASITGAQEIPGIPYNVPITSHDGYVFLNSDDKLSKYEVGENGILIDRGSLPNLGISGGPVYEFISDSRMLISSGPRATSDGVFQYQIINTESMTQVSTGSITLPTDSNSKSIPSAYILKEGKIYVPYIHSDEKYVAYNEAPVAIFNASDLTYEKTIYTDKTASLAYSVVSSHGFSENGDLYITSCNSDYWGANESLPSGIVRINAGSSDFDDSYFFNLTEALDGNHTGGMLYVGNNKAIVQVFRSDLITAYGDYQGGFVIEYHLVDLLTKSTSKLDIPLSRYPRRAMALTAGGKAVIMANTQTDGNAFHIYDPASNSTSKGLTYEGAEFMSAFFPITD